MKRLYIQIICLYGRHLFSNLPHASSKTPPLFDVFLRIHDMAANIIREDL